MNPSLGAVVAAGDAARFAQRYEALRAWVLDGPAPGTRPAGLALVLRRGLPTWLDAAALWLPALERPTPTFLARPDADAAATNLVVQVLATMVERYREERTP